MHIILQAGGARQPIFASCARFCLPGSDKSTPEQAPQLLGASRLRGALKHLLPAYVRCAQDHFFYDRIQLMQDHCRADNHSTAQYNPLPQHKDTFSSRSTCFHFHPFPAFPQFDDQADQQHNHQGHIGCNCPLAERCNCARLLEPLAQSAAIPKPGVDCLRHCQRARKQRVHAAFQQNEPLPRLEAGLVPPFQQPCGEKRQNCDQQRDKMVRERGPLPGLC